ncbi:MOS1T transposase, partial [Pseudoatta argentina]
MRGSIVGQPTETEETVNARGAFRIVLYARDAGRKSPDTLEMKKRITANAQKWGPHAERGGLKSNLWSGRMRRSRPVRCEKEAEGPARRANRLDTEVEGEADYTRKSEDSRRGPEANAQSISRTRLGAIASVGGLRTVAATDQPTNRFLLGINSFNTPAAAAVNTLSQNYCFNGRKEKVFCQSPYRDAQRHDKVILLHDNARPHVGKPVKTYLETLKWEVLPHPPYSPDIAPSDFHLF